MLSVGDYIEPFEVEVLLGRGAMATVWGVRRRDTGGRYALKVLAAGGERLRERLAREARALLSMRHPSVVSLTDLVDVRGHPALVMERVDGLTLEQLLAREVLDYAVVDRLFGQVLDGVEVAHDRGLVHRDIKPSNVLVAVVDGLRLAKVSDFGLVKALRPPPGEGALTQAFEALGTPGYVAPEQLLHAAGADTRADVFSLGCLLYRMVAGRAPFPGELNASIVASSRGEYPPLAHVVADVPPAYAEAVDVCLRPDREDRPPSVSALRALVQRGPVARRSTPSGGLDAGPEALSLGGLASAIDAVDAPTSQRPGERDPGYDPRVRRGQSTVEYMLTISVISIAIAAVILALGSAMQASAKSLGASMATSLTTDGVQ